MASLSAPSIVTPQKILKVENMPIPSELSDLIESCGVMLDKVEERGWPDEVDFLRKLLAGPWTHKSGYETDTGRGTANDSNNARTVHRLMKLERPVKAYAELKTHWSGIKFMLDNQKYINWVLDRETEKQGAV